MCLNFFFTIVQHSNFWEKMQFFGSQSDLAPKKLFLANFHKKKFPGPHNGIKKPCQLWFFFIWAKNGPWIQNLRRWKNCGGQKWPFFRSGNFSLIRHNSTYFWSWEMFETIFRILRPSAFRWTCQISTETSVRGLKSWKTAGGCINFRAHCILLRGFSDMACHTFIFVQKFCSNGAFKVLKDISDDFFCGKIGH